MSMPALRLARRVQPRLWDEDDGGVSFCLPGTARRPSGRWAFFPCSDVGGGVPPLVAALTSARH